MAIKNIVACHFVHIINKQWANKDLPMDRLIANVCDTKRFFFVAFIRFSAVALPRSMQTSNDKTVCDAAKPTSQSIIVLDQVHVINLKRRSDRWRKVLPRLQKHLPSNAVVTRVDAIDGTDPMNSFTGVQALAKTFLGILDNISDRFKDDDNRKKKWVIILEDDVLVHRNFPYLYACFIEKLDRMSCSTVDKVIPPFVYLGANQPDLRKDVDWRTEQRNIDGLLYKCLGRVTHGAFAIIYNVEAVTSLLREPIRERCMHKPYDNILNEIAASLDPQMWAQPFVVYPNLLIADVSDSDLRGKRNQARFAKAQHWDMQCYE